MATTPSHADGVLQAARTLVDAFSRHDTQAYFAAFAPEASFIFHTYATVLPTRAAYQALWAEWERAIGFRVLSCRSQDATVQMLGEVGVFCHQVHTVVGTHDGEIALDERETIVFQRYADGQWLAVHEHLSPMPVAAEVTV
ncbi:MAG: nuclear transport factor 2 family protein [Burkholderiales bacterium]|nr:nuclear transport factor 2 family protein [Burkholderiales bacterium]